MPVLDGFGITSALRDFERARRNRASTVRAATVEEHGKVTASTRGHGLERDIGGEKGRPPDVFLVDVYCAKGENLSNRTHA